MHIIIGIGAAIALLYFWLIGHWFARVLVFLLLAVTLGVGGAGIVGTFNHPMVSNGWGPQQASSPHAPTKAELLAAEENVQNELFLARTGARASDRPEDDPDVALGRAIVARDQLLARMERIAPAATAPSQPEASIAPEILGALVGLALAWPVSSIPIYYRRRQAKGVV
jgi:hypothetical protein